jgi:hypothetical protein
MVDSAPGAIWEVGTGRSEAYMLWQEATAKAAQEAESAGDSQTADRLLAQLERAYASDLRRSALEGSKVFAEAVQKASSPTAPQANQYTDLLDIVRTR